MRERGSGSLFREKYRDKKTGQLKVCRTWTMKLWVGGKSLKRPSETTSRAVANKQLEQWKAEVRQGIYVPDADQTRFDDLASLLCGMPGTGNLDGAYPRLRAPPAGTAGRQRHHQPRAGSAQADVPAW